MTTRRERLLAFRQSIGRAPRLSRRTVRARGLDFAVWTTPSVPDALPLLCVNGGLIYDHGILWPALAPLAAGRQLVLYDQRGRGATTPPPGVRAARIEHDAGDVAALRVALGIERWDVLGHSWGGGVAMLGVVDDQAATRRLVLVDPVGPTGDWLPGLHALALERLRARDDGTYEALWARDPVELRVADPAVHSAYARAFYPAWFADPELGRASHPPESTSATGATIAARMRRDGYDWTDRVRALSVPSLVLHGERDVLSVEQSRRTVSLLPHARLETLADAGHLPFWEAADRFFPIVDDFLGARPATTPPRPTPPAAPPSPHADGPPFRCATS